MKTKAARILESLPNDFMYKETFRNNKDLSLKQMLRDSIQGEFDAISLYEAQIASTDNPLVKKVLSDIRDEEIAHVGELYSLFVKVFPEDKESLRTGFSEFRDMELD